MSKLKPKKDKTHSEAAIPDMPPGQSVADLIEKLSPEDTQTLIDVLTNHENARLVSTLEAKALLEQLVKGEK